MLTLVLQVGIVTSMILLVSTNQFNYTPGACWKFQHPALATIINVTGVWLGRYA